MSAEIQESLQQLQGDRRVQPPRLLPAEVRRRERGNYAASVAAGLANNVFMPIYGLALQPGAAHRAGVRHLADRARASSRSALLIGFLLYVNSFYMPLRQLAAVWSSFQLALAALDRISAVLALESNMPVVRRRSRARSGAACSSSSTCRFSYPGGTGGAERQRRSRSSAARPTRWSVRPAAARRPRRR